jgi:hypothetical protein
MTYFIAIFCDFSAAPARSDTKPATLFIGVRPSALQNALNVFHRPIGIVMFVLAQ